VVKLTTAICWPIMQRVSQKMADLSVPASRRSLRSGKAMIHNMHCFPSVVFSTNCIVLFHQQSQMLTVQRHYNLNFNFCPQGRGFTFTKRR